MPRVAGMMAMCLAPRESAWRINRCARLLGEAALPPEQTARTCAWRWLRSARRNLYGALLWQTCSWPQESVGQNDVEGLPLRTRTIQRTALGANSKACWHNGHALGAQRGRLAHQQICTPFGWHALAARRRCSDIHFVLVAERLAQFQWCVVIANLFLA